MERVQKNAMALTIVYCCCVILILVCEQATADEEIYAINGKHVKFGPNNVFGIQAVDGKTTIFGLHFGNGHEGYDVRTDQEVILGPGNEMDLVYVCNDNGIVTLEKKPENESPSNALVVVRKLIGHDYTYVIEFPEVKNGPLFLDLGKEPLSCKERASGIQFWLNEYLPQTRMSSSSHEEDVM